MAVPRWNPAQYLRFADHRSRPFFDLVGRIGADAPRRVVDLGCGPGALTTTLAERWPGAEVVGLDSSSEMIEAAADQDPGHRVRFELADIETWQPSSTDDVVVTNAALQWVPDHRRLMSRWLEALPGGAWFAMQVPGSAVLPSHRILRDMALSEEWRDRLGQVTRPVESVGEAADYLALLLEAGFEADAWETTYQQVLPGEDAVLEWVRSTSLRPMLEALGPADATAFEGLYAAALREAYPALPAGTVYPFRRIFAVGRKR